MKTPTKPTAPRMPRARVMHEYTSGAQYAKPLPGTHPVVLIPVSTGNKKRDAQHARKLAAFFNLTEEERVEKLAKDIFSHKNPNEPWGAWKHGDAAEACRKMAVAVLAVITGGRT